MGTNTRSPRLPSSSTPPPPAAAPSNKKRLQARSLEDARLRVVVRRRRRDGAVEVDPDLGHRLDLRLDLDGLRGERLGIGWAIGKGGCGREG